MPNLTPLRRTWLICLCLVAATCFAYWRVGRAEFISVDDGYYVSENQVVQAGLTANGVKWAFSDARVANYHPVTWLSHMLDCQLFGADPAWHHRVNVVYHCGCAVLLFFVIRRMTGREGCSAFVAFVFALHPQHVESVAWVSERKDVLSALFFILTLGCYTLYVERRSRGFYALALLMFALGLLSKPMLVTLPCVLLLVDFWPLRRTTLLRDEPSPEPLWKSLVPLVIEKLPFFLLSVGGCIATVIAQSSSGAVLTTKQVPLDMRIGNALVAYARYLRKFFWPSDLAILYPLLRPWPIVLVVGAALLLLAITVVAVVLWRKKPYVAVGWLWFVGMLVPVIGLVQVGNQAMADRYMYLPMIGLTMIVAWAVAELLPRRSWQFAAAGVALAACTLITFNDVKYWQNSETLFARAIERTEPSVFGLHNLAASQMQRGKTELAIQNYEKCLKLNPANTHVRRALGYAYQTLQKYDVAHTHLDQALRMNTSDADSWDAMGNLHAQQSHWPEAAKHFQTAVQLKPDAFKTWIKLGIVNRQLRKFGDAEASLQQALKINPRSAEPWYMLGRLRHEAGRSAEAIEPLQRAIALEPAHADPHYQLGLALMACGRGAEASSALMAALQRSPNAPDVLGKLAWLLATHPDEKLRRGEDAMFLATRANALTNSSNPAFLDALAAAQAEQQQFDAAAETATKAATLARTSRDAKLAEQIESRVAKYRAHSAVRDSSLAGTDFGDATR